MRIPATEWRSIDGLIAEHVFEWTRGEAGACTFDGKVVGLPFFMSDMGQAWEVVGKLREIGYQLELSESAGSWSAMFDADLVSGEEPMQGDAEDCESAQIAICVAALATRGVSIEALYAQQLEGEVTVQ